MCTLRGHLPPSQRIVLRRTQTLLLPVKLINAPSWMGQILSNTTTRDVLFLTHQAPHSQAQCGPSCSTGSSQATSLRAYLRTQRWNLGSSETHALILLSLIPSKFRVPSVFQPRSPSISQEEDTYRPPYRLQGCSRCSMMTSCPSLLPRGARTKCRPRPLYRLLCSESLQASKRLKLEATTILAIATGTRLRLLRAAIARRAISLLLWHRTALLTLACPL